MTTTLGNSTCSANIGPSDAGAILWFDPRREHSSVPTTSGKFKPVALDQIRTAGNSLPMQSWVLPYFRSGPRSRASIASANSCVRAGHCAVQIQQSTQLDGSRRMVWMTQPGMNRRSVCKPDANIGGATGAIVAVDVDPRHGGDAALSKLEARHGALPRTWRAITGSGGAHIYFRSPDGVILRSQIAGWPTASTRPGGVPGWSAFLKKPDEKCSL
jgi:hypothetical protein